MLNWGVELSQLNVVLVLNSGQMVKAVIETGAAATAISELIVEKEIQLSTLRPLADIDNRQDDWANTEIIRPFLKHWQRFQTRLSLAFEQTLMK